ncbi:MAG TPA: isoleucine--tRNA ligase [Candidatus Limnocylindrales bacterium]|nr:isoleucine--tRNA ligase [Candidatus Limnocylindrales bacterium]
MDYKHTLQLPSTDFPMRANLPQREPAMLETWRQERIYERMLEVRQDRPLFLLHDGPPYANGHIHIGHSMNKILKDINVKYKALAGFRAPYRPGWDCHGLPIELEVEKQIGRKAKSEMSLVEVRRLCRDYADRYVDIQRRDFQRLGVFGEWERPYLTKDFDYEAREVRELADILATGAMFRGRKPVHWCASCRTALAEAEVDYDEKTSTSVFVAFALPAQGPLAAFADRSLAIAIWTTTPWTLPANLAVAVGPDFSYSLVEAGERALVVATDLVEPLRARLQLGQTLATFRGIELEGIEARHPWIDRASRIVVGEHVGLDTGTGAVHTAPGHGHDDYVVGQRYGLEAYAPVNAAGCFTEEVPDFAGRFVFEADADIVVLLRERGALLGEEPIRHSYPHCWRCKKAIIFRATEQWFLSMEHSGLRARALAAIDEVRWVPSWGRERIHGMIANRPDWCLSRQRAWGVPIVALRCAGCGEVAATPELMRHAADIFEHEGSDAWFARPVADFVPDGFSCAGCGNAQFERETDILDVWFDSGASFAAVVEQDLGSQTIADLYLEGSDQHRGWFHSTLLVSVATRGRAPYRSVLTHGFVLDGEGRKQSKSLGNVVAPQDILKTYGADILRLWVAAEDYSDDVRISDEIMKRLADSYRRIRNTCRNLLANLADYDPSAHAVAAADMSELDLWVLSRLDEFVTRCRRAYDEYQFHIVFHALNNFCSVDLSALYFDIVKDRLYCSGKDSVERRSSQTAMHAILLALVRVIAPVLCFTADEVWRAIAPAQKPSGGDPTSVFLSDFPSVDPAWHDEARASRWARIWEIRAVVTKALEEQRRAGILGQSLEARVQLASSGRDAELLTELGEKALCELLIVSQVELVHGVGDIEVAVERARGGKCGRCWKFSESVGTHGDHPELCDRCHGVVASL